MLQRPLLIFLFLIACVSCLQPYPSGSFITTEKGLESSFSPFMPYLLGAAGKAMKAIPNTNQTHFFLSFHKVYIESTFYNLNFTIFDENKISVNISFQPLSIHNIFLLVHGYQTTKCPSLTISQDLSISYNFNITTGPLGEIAFNFSLEGSTLANPTVSNCNFIGPTVLSDLFAITETILIHSLNKSIEDYSLNATARQTVPLYSDSNSNSTLYTTYNITQLTTSNGGPLYFSFNSTLYYEDYQETNFYNFENTNSPLDNTSWGSNVDNGLRLTVSFLDGILWYFSENNLLSIPFNVSLLDANFTFVGQINEAHLNILDSQFFTLESKTGSLKLECSQCGEANSLNTVSFLNSTLSSPIVTANIYPLNDTSFAANISKFVLDDLSVYHPNLPFSGESLTSLISDTFTNWSSTINDLIAYSPLTIPTILQPTFPKSSISLFTNSSFSFVEMRSEVSSMVASSVKSPVQDFQNHIFSSKLPVEQATVSTFLQVYTNPSCELRYFGDTGIGYWLNDTIGACTAVDINNVTAYALRNESGIYFPCQTQDCTSCLSKQSSSCTTASPFSSILLSEPCLGAPSHSSGKAMVLLDGNFSDCVPPQSPPKFGLQMEIIYVGEPTTAAVCENITYAVKTFDNYHIKLYCVKNDSCVDCLLNFPNRPLDTCFVGSQLSSILKSSLNTCGTVPNIEEAVSVSSSKKHDSSDFDNLYWLFLLLIPFGFGIFLLHLSYGESSSVVRGISWLYGFLFANFFIPPMYFVYQKLYSASKHPNNSKEIIPNSIATIVTLFLSLGLLAVNVFLLPYSSASSLVDTPDFSLEGFDSFLLFCVILSVVIFLSIFLILIVNFYTYQNFNFAVFILIMMQFVVLFIPLFVFEFSNSVEILAPETNSSSTLFNSDKSTRDQLDTLFGYLIFQLVMIRTDFLFASFLLPLSVSLCLARHVSFVRFGFGLNDRFNGIYFALPFILSYFPFVILNQITTWVLLMICLIVWIFPLGLLLYEYHSSKIFTKVPLILCSILTFCGLILICIAAPDANTIASCILLFFLGFVSQTLLALYIMNETYDSNVLNSLSTPLIEKVDFNEQISASDDLDDEIELSEPIQESWTSSILNKFNFVIDNFSTVPWVAPHKYHIEFSMSISLVSILLLFALAILVLGVVVSCAIIALPFYILFYIFLYVVQILPHNLKRRFFSYDSRILILTPNTTNLDVVLNHQLHFIQFPPSHPSEWPRLFKLIASCSHHFMFPDICKNSNEIPLSILKLVQNLPYFPFWGVKKVYQFEPTIVSNNLFETPNHSSETLEYPSLYQVISEIQSEAHPKVMKIIFLPITIVFSIIDILFPELHTWLFEEKERDRPDIYGYRVELRRFSVLVGIFALLYEFIVSFSEVWVHDSVSRVEEWLHLQGIEIQMEDSGGIFKTVFETYDSTLRIGQICLYLAFLAFCWSLYEDVKQTSEAETKIAGKSISKSAESLQDEDSTLLPTSIYFYHDLSFDLCPPHLVQSMHLSIFAGVFAVLSLIIPNAPNYLDIFGYQTLFPNCAPEFDQHFLLGLKSLSSYFISFYLSYSLAFVILSAPFAIIRIAAMLSEDLKTRFSKHKSQIEPSIKRVILLGGLLNFPCLAIQMTFFSQYSNDAFVCFNVVVFLCLPPLVLWWSLNKYSSPSVPFMLWRIAYYSLFLLLILYQVSFTDFLNNIFSVEFFVFLALDFALTDVVSGDLISLTVLRKILEEEEEDL